TDPSISKALPWSKAPVIGDGSLVGDVGFDPLGLAQTFDLGWMRAAELKHGRVCMLATVGFLAPELIQHPVGFSGFEFAPEFTQMNAFLALNEVPRFGLAQIVLACGLIEVASFGSNYSTAFAFEDNLSPLERKAVQDGKRSFLTGAAKTTSSSKVNAFGEAYEEGFAEGQSTTPGDLGFDPLGLAANGVNPDYALAEIKHCRLAMIGFLGMALQQFNDQNGGTLEQFMNWAT
ncbi:unnamed protein product, partial [Choristocarpus tenellus]